MLTPHQHPYSHQSHSHTGGHHQQEQHLQETQQQQEQQQKPVPMYNGINPHYPGLQKLHHDPPVYAVPNFLTPQECAFLVEAADDSWTAAPVVGAGAGEISQTRTSSTCYLDRADLPDLMRKVSVLTGKSMEHCELPQVGRYLPTQQYYQHYDAFNLNEEDGVRFAENGGQRTVTVLVYLNNVATGGQTSFPTLNLSIQPVQGMALIFFPATVDGALDPRALHAALPAVDPKYVSQVWIRQGVYSGVPSKRLEHTMGPALTKEEIAASGAGAVAGAGLFGSVNGHVMTLHQPQTSSSQQSHSNNSHGAGQHL